MTKLFAKPLFKLVGSALLVLLVLLTAFHLWFRDHAEEVIEELVDARSHGKVHLQLKKFRFNYFSRRMELQNAVFYTTDSTNAPSSYRFRVDRIKIELHSFWQLVLKGQLNIDSLTLLSPDIQALRLRPFDNSRGSEVSIPREMGRIYKSINEGLNVLQVKKFGIEEGTFSIINNMETGKRPITISHIDFYINNLEPDSSAINNPAKYLYNDNMVLRTHNQHIELPDGRHTIAFRQFRINIRRELIEMDSCTIAAEKTDSTRAAFSVFFDTLRLSTVDFTSLYQSNLVKADSVYCTKPDIKLWIGLKNNQHGKIPLPTLKQLIQPLTGDLQLGYVGIADASINILASRNDQAASISSKNDNIEMTDLRINSDSSHPFYLKTFSIAIRDYETINRDSTLAFRFDSIKFFNNKVVLSNFTVHTLHGKHPVYAERNYSVPHFELENLSWDELLFNKNIKASKAVLYDPVMNYQRLKPRMNGQKLTLFKALGTIDNLMELQQLQVINGQLNIQLDSRTKVNLQNADILVSSNELLKSKNISAIQESVNQLQFGQGTITINDLRAEMKNVRFTGQDQQLAADELIVHDSANTIRAEATNVFMNELYYNDSSRQLSVDGLRWQQASVRFTAIPKRSKPSRSSISLRNIQGTNTLLFIHNASQTITTDVLELSAAEVLKPANERTSIKEFAATGKNFMLVQDSLWIEAAAYAISDQKPSSLQGACFEQSGLNVNFTGSVKTIQFTPSLQEILDKKFEFEHLAIDRPVIVIQSKKNRQSTAFKNKPAPALMIKEINVSNPSLYYMQKDSGSSAGFSWPGLVTAAGKNTLSLHNIVIDKQSGSIAIRNFNARSSGFIYQSPSGNRWGIDSGYVSVEGNDIRKIITGKDSAGWRGTISTLQLKNLNPFKTKKNGQLNIDQTTLDNILLPAQGFRDYTVFLEKNPAFRISNTNGRFINATTAINWYNFYYNNQDKQSGVDSFTIAPAMPEDSFANAHKFQRDYITASAGRTTLSNFDLPFYIQRNILKGGMLDITQPVITAVRDTRKPFEAGKLKPLPAAWLQKIGLLLNLDSIRLSGGYVDYTQFYLKSKQFAAITFNKLAAALTTIKNVDIAGRDSLTLDASARLNGTIPLHLFARESYTDSLSGMLLYLQMQQADLTSLNPLLEKAGLIRLPSGYLDSLQMTAVANEYTAVGKMKTTYHDLKLAILKKGKGSAQTNVAKFKSFLVNSFALRHKNTDRTAVVYFTRNRDRSFFNYLAKMTLNGISKSAGLKREKKKIQRAHKKLLQKKLPAYYKN